MEVSYDGTQLDDDLVLTEIDLKEGSKIQVKVLEADEVDEPEPNPEAPQTQENVGDLKLEAYEQFREKVPFLCDLAARQYGLFLLDGTPTTDSRGNLRYLKKSERLNEKQTVEENGLEGGEELIFGSLAWMVSSVMTRAPGCWPSRTKRLDDGAPVNEKVVGFVSIPPARFARVEAELDLVKSNWRRQCQLTPII
ncbi:hypothetical protein AK812_SmicGene6559 [Symbiodinium microadriaticum]|uniref:Ubiquitin-like domain-containing protein n=1 Tax=Symbiodinium microadriaticum TaxID=2951 RepID=A0A1Q9ER12_SYMMI|nr:hypothetical protein AK812_SmicGene6559 [Symbiodinium microadriaticum]